MRTLGIELSPYTVAGLYESQAGQPRRVDPVRVERIEKIASHTETASRRALPPREQQKTTYDLKARSSRLPVATGRILNIRA